MKTSVPKVSSKDGTKIAYDKVGNGPAVVLVLGALNSRSSGTELAKRLESRFTVISYDRRGRGDSTDTLPYSPEREVEDIEALIEAGGSASLYGHSSGGALALEAAIRLGNKVKRLAIYEAPYDSSGAALKATREYNKRLAELLKAGSKGDAVALFMKFVGVPSEQIQGMRHAPMWRALETMAPTLAYESAVMGEDRKVPAGRAAKIAVPTLVMAGGASPASMHDAARALTEAIPKAHLRTLDGQIHDVKSEVLAPVLDEFFSGK